MPPAVKDESGGTKRKRAKSDGEEKKRFGPKRRKRRTDAERRGHVVAFELWKKLNPQGTLRYYCRTHYGRAHENQWCKFLSAGKGGWRYPSTRIKILGEMANPEDSKPLESKGKRVKPGVYTSTGKRGHWTAAEKVSHIQRCEAWLDENPKGTLRSFCRYHYGSVHEGRWAKNLTKGKGGWRYQETREKLFLQAGESDSSGPPPAEYEPAVPEQESLVSV